MTLNFGVEFDTKLHKKPNRAKKTRTRVSADFLGPKVTTPPNLGVDRNFCGSGRIFENFRLRDFFQKNFLSLFSAFFSDFFQKIVKK